MSLLPSESLLLASLLTLVVRVAHVLSELVDIVPGAIILGSHVVSGSIIGLIDIIPSILLLPLSSSEETPNLAGKLGHLTFSLSGSVFDVVYT
jgi:hypothetical protein